MHSIPSTHATRNNASPSPAYSRERAGERVFSARSCDGAAVAETLSKTLYPTLYPEFRGEGASLQ
jgi:hypothetical protein